MGADEVAMCDSFTQVIKQVNSLSMDKLPIKPK